MKTNNLLLQPHALTKKITLKNRVVMAPMTRSMSGPNSVPTAAMVDYYARRADAGLIVTEGTIIQADGTGYPDVPGIFTQEHIDAWKKVTDKVHQNNGVIFQQIWHVGRVSHPNYLNGQLPISSSATMLTGHIPRSGNLEYGQSRAATKAEINQLIENYAVAAENAIKAGFDGVEIHGANGYLIDQFMHYNTNLRTDEYGGTSENMARFPLQVVKAVAERVGYDRVGIRISPAAYLNVEADKRDTAVFKYLLQQLSDLPIAYVHTGNFDDRVEFAELDGLTMTDFIRFHYRGTLIASGSYSFASATVGINDNDFDLVAIGRPFIANPDLITKLETNGELKAYDDAMLQSLY